MTSERPLADEDPLAAMSGDVGRGPALLLALVGFGFGLGQWWGGLYAVHLWGPVSVVVVVGLIAFVVALGTVPPKAGSALVGGLAALGVISALSATWAESAANTTFEAQRWLLYAAVSMLVLLLARGQREQRALVLGSGIAGLLVAAWLWAEMALGDGAGRFTVMRLSEPLGYANGQAAAFLLAAWPAFAVAEHARRTAVRGAAASAVVLLIGLTVLTQSRGAALGLVASVAVVVVFLPRREPRIWLMVVVGLGMSVAAPALLDVYTSGLPSQGQPVPSVQRTAALMLALGAIASGALWAGAGLLAARLHGRSARQARHVGRLVLTILLIVGVVGTLITVGNPIDRFDHLQSQFTSLDVPNAADPSSRLTSGGGNRYDYWRVALEEFRAHPLGGEGAGNYTRDYFRLRATSEDVRQPHSLELQVMAELGIAGLALLIAIVAALTTAVWRGRERLQVAGGDAVVAVAGVGIVVVWLVQTSVDWLHLLPSLTAGALAVAAALVKFPGAASSRMHPAAAAVIAVSLAIAAAGIGRLTLADRAGSAARDDLDAAPEAAVAQANRSLTLQPDVLPVLYVKAAALARLNDYEGARDILQHAVAAEPSNFVPRVLLGDLAVRRGDIALARRRYREAKRLNPRDPQIAKRVQSVQAR